MFVGGVSCVEVFQIGFTKHLGAEPWWIFLLLFDFFISLRVLSTSNSLSISRPVNTFSFKFFALV